MDAETRRETNALHGRINDLGTRLTVIETNSVHISTELGKIRGGISKLIWIVGSAFVVVLVKFVVDGGFSVPI